MLFRTKRRMARFVDKSLAKRNPYELLSRLYEELVLTRLQNWDQREGYTEYLLRQRQLIEDGPRCLRMVRHLKRFIMEVNNGGVVQYFWNFSGEDAEDLLEDLKELGMVELRDAMAAARTEIFGGPVPTNIDARREAMDAYFGTHPYNDDDDYERLAAMRPAPQADHAGDLFHEWEDRLMESLRQWALRHREEFLEAAGAI